MRARNLLLSFNPVPGTSLWLQIVQILQAAILDGRLPPGTALPGSRVLSEMLGVNRLTVIPALQELEAQGWLETKPNRGTFVALELPIDVGVQRTTDETQSKKLGFDLPSFLRPITSTLSGSAINLSDGAPDPRLAPSEELARGYQRAMRRHGTRLLEDRDPFGTPLLREAVAAWVSERHGTQIEAGRVLITRGSRGSLALLAGALFRPGECAAVENPGNRNAWEILQRTGRLALRPVAIDCEGMNPGALAEALTDSQVRALYLTPRRQFPTGASMSGARGAELLRLAEKHRLIVIEDDYDGEIRYSGKRQEPLFAHDNSGQVIHIGSLSRLLAPGLRLGYMVVPAPLAPFLARVKRGQEEQGDPALEWAVADLIRDGDLARHLRRTLKIYRSRRDHLLVLLHECLGEELNMDIPDGGMALWLKVKDGIDAETWIRKARSANLVLNPPSYFQMGGAALAFRMGFAQADEAELEEAVGRLKLALPSSRPDSTGKPARTRPKG